MYIEYTKRGENMGIGYRIKEAREALGLTQDELGKLVGVTGSSITNYEKETSHPKEPIMYKLIDALQVDANFLFQDSVKPRKKIEFGIEDYEIIKKYHALDEHGKEMVDFTLSKEYERSVAEKCKNNNNIVSINQKNIEHLVPNAAHERTDIEITEEERIEDENMMD